MAQPTVAYKSMTFGEGGSALTFTALALLSVLGIAIFFSLTALEWLLLHRWHDSAVKKQG